MKHYYIVTESIAYMKDKMRYAAKKQWFQTLNELNTVY